MLSGRWFDYNINLCIEKGKKMNWFYKFNVSLILLVTLLACGATPTADNTGKIEGTVSSFSTGLPVGFANITTVPPTSAVTSDSTTGMFTILHVDPGIYKVHAEKAGYDTANVNISVVAGEKSIADIALKLKP